MYINLSQISYHLQQRLGCHLSHLPTAFYHHSSAVVLVIVFMLSHFLPVPSCDAFNVQLSLTNIYWISTVFQASWYVLGEKQSLLGHSSAFKEFIDSELVKLNQPQHTGIRTLRQVHTGLETTSGKKAFRVGGEGNCHEQTTLEQDSNAKMRARLEERSSWMTIPQPSLAWL